jgi:hypothetical protein
VSLLFALLFLLVAWVASRKERRKRSRSSFLDHGHGRKRICASLNVRSCGVGGEFTPLVYLLVRQRTRVDVSFRSFSSRSPSNDDGSMDGELNESGFKSIV